MAQFNYKPIFTVKTFHSYFDVGTFTKLLFKPDPSTSKFMSQYGMVINSADHSTSLFVRTGESLESFLEKV